MKMFIGGKWTDASNGASKESSNPATGAVLGTFPCATREDVQLALDCAQAAQKVWRDMPFNRRARILSRAAELFEAHEEELTELLIREIGKQRFAARDEAAEAAPLFRSSVAAGTHLYGNTYPNHAVGGTYGDLAFSVIEPLGVVVCITPFNFPIGTLTFKVAPALAMGNTVIIKPASDCALTVLRYVEILLEAGFPENTVQVVTGAGGELGKWLVDNGQINAVSFTGSTEVGAALLETSAKHFHRMLLELGGNDPFLILPDADLDRAVDESMVRKINSGQICCMAKRFLVHNSIRAEYVRRLAAAIDGLKVGDPIEDETDMGPCVSLAAAKSVEVEVARAVEQGASLVRGGKRDGAFFAPTLLDNVTRGMDVARDLELFGPVWTVIGYDTEAEAIEIANQTSYGLIKGV